MSRAVSFDIQWPKEDVDALFRAMDSARKWLGYDMGHALRAAAKHLIQSLGASTRVAPKFRKISPATWLEDDARQRWERGHLSARKLLAFDVTGWFGAPRKYGTKQVFSRDLDTAKRRHATIGRRGLAKAAWGSVSFLQSGPRLVFVNGKASITREAAKFVSASASFDKTDQYIEINNYLPYAELALHGGPRDVSTAMERAARAMEKSVEKQLVKRMGLGRLS